MKMLNMVTCYSAKADQVGFIFPGSGPVRTRPHLVSRGNSAVRFSVNADGRFGTRKYEYNKDTAEVSRGMAMESGSGMMRNKMIIPWGRMAEDGLSYKENFVVRAYEVGANKTATIETIANYLQEAACNHVKNLGFWADGFPTSNTMRKMHLVWVTSRMHIEMYKYPAWDDVVEIETWFQDEGKIGTRRDWILKDYITGQVIGKATRWAMMNQNTRRLQKVNDDVKEEYLRFSPIEPRLAFPKKNSRNTKKILKLEDLPQYSKLEISPRRFDLDMNRYVNNVTYIGWILESMPQEIMNNYELQTITLDYRRECRSGDMVDSFTSTEPSESYEGTNGYATLIKENRDYLNFLHLLSLSSVGLEINRGRTEWRKKL